MSHSGGVDQCPAHLSAGPYLPTQSVGYGKGAGYLKYMYMYYLSFLCMISFDLHVCSLSNSLFQ